MPLLSISFEEEDDVSPILPTPILPSLQYYQLSDKSKFSFISIDAGITFDNYASIAFEN